MGNANSVGDLASMEGVAADVPGEAPSPGFSSLLLSPLQAHAEARSAAARTNPD